VKEIDAIMKRRYKNKNVILEWMKSIFLFLFFLN
jgi:hypothetical protein